MSLQKFNGKTLAECQGLEITAVRSSAPNNYKCVLIKVPGMDYGTDENGNKRMFMCVMLGRTLASEVNIGEKLSQKCKIVLTVNGDGEERWKIGRPEAQFFKAEELPY